MRKFIIFFNNFLKNLLIFNSFFFNFFFTFKRLLPTNWKRINKNYLLAFIANHIIYYPTPITLTYAWSFGSLAGICLVIQIISGTLLSVHYTANIELAFYSVEYIMRDVPNGWFIRYVHANGASMFFIVIYCHIFKGIYYGSYMKPRQMLWCSGVIIFFIVNGSSIYRLCFTVGSNEFLGCNCYY
jgi:ubiquinol-cytochrome c reductase cytochrome b subunit